MQIPFSFEEPDSLEKPDAVSLKEPDPTSFEESEATLWERLRRWLAPRTAAACRWFTPRAMAVRRWFTPRTVAIIAGVSTALCFVSAAALAVIVLKGGPKSAAAAQDRAWLSPVSIIISRAPLRSDGIPRIDVTLDYVNVGDEPARGVVVQMRSGTKSQDVSSDALNAVYAGDNPTCDSLITPDKGGVVLPSSTVAQSFSQTDIMSNEAAIEHLQGVLVVQACLKYHTADGAIRTTKLCQYVEPELDKPLDQRRLRSCADGNDAN
jgi:hypothetical protein